MVAKKTKTKKVTSARKSVKTAKVVMPVEPVAQTVETSSMPMPKLPPMKVSPKVLATVVVLVGVGLLTYKLGPWLVPAIVGKTPITRWQVYQRLEKNYGAQALDDMINEKVLDMAIAKTGVSVPKADVDAQLSKIEDQFKSMGGLDAALKSRGLTKDDLTKQVTTQLQVEAILKDKITPSDSEVQKYFDDNSKTLYKDKKIDDVKSEIVDSLKQSKLQSEFMTWFAEAKKGVTVKNFAPTPVSPVPQQ